MLEEEVYAYPVTRVRAMKKRLLRRDFFERLMSLTFPEIIEELRRAGYGGDFDLFSPRYSDVALLDFALNNNLANTLRKIYFFLPDELKDMVKSFLIKWDIYNIKTILRGKFQGISGEEILADLVFAGELGKKDFEPLLKAKNRNEVINYLKKTEFGGIIASANDNLFALENALDSFYLSKTADPLLKIQIDTKNILSALRSIENFLKGGKLSLDKIKRIQTNPEYLKETEYGKFITDPNNIVLTERELEKHVMRKGTALLRGYPLSIQPIIGYMFAKENEIITLRVIGKCRAEGFGREEIEQLI
jgi:V/A-type H+-transporting ATPase subunit C